MLGESVGRLDIVSRPFLILWTGRGSGQAVPMMEGAMAEVPEESRDGPHDKGEEADDDSEEEDAE